MFFLFVINTSYKAESMYQERFSLDDVLRWIVCHEPVLSYGNLSVAGKFCHTVYYTPRYW